MENILFIIGIILIIFGLVLWIIKLIKQKPKYDVCNRCGSMLQANHIYKNHCYICVVLDDENAKKLRRNV